MKLYAVLFCAGILFIISTTPVFSQQIDKGTIIMNPPSVINFKEKAAYALSHPRPKPKQRFIEQGEDREGRHHFKPKAIPADAKKFDVAIPLNTLRTVSPSPTVSFNGILDNGTLIPPDISGAAGNDYVVESTNQEIDIYTKSGSQNSVLDIATFFSPANGNNFFDPHVVYDQIFQRFIICSAGFYSNNHSALFIGVSQTDDPTGSWYIYSFDAIGNSNDFLDFPQIGFNNNWIVLTGNDFLSNYNTTSKIYVLNREDMYAGSAGTVHTYTDGSVFGITPSVTADTAVNTEYLVADWDGNNAGFGYIRLYTITGTPNAPTYTAGSTIGVNQPWDENTVNAPQKNSTHKLEVSDTRINTPIYIKGSIWFTHSVFLPAGNPDYAGVDWWQVNPSNSTVLQFGRLEDGSHHTFYYYPGICVNKVGDALLGYSLSSSDMYAGTQYSFHPATDSLNTLEDGYLFNPGLASYWKDFGGGRNRWGDYTATCTDPIDNSFWTFQEFANTPANTWGTVVANVGGVPCMNVPTAGMITGVSSVCPGESAILQLDGYTNGFIGIKLQWEQSADGVTAWSNAGGFGSNSSKFETGPLSDAVYYRCVVSCSTAGLSDTTLVFEIKVSGFVPVSNDTICSPGITSLIAAAGNPVKWFVTDTSSTPFFTGDTLIADVLSDTTFYVSASTLAYNTAGIPGSGNGSYYNFTYGAGLIFDALSSFTLDTVYVYPNSTGIIQINLVNSSLGKVIDSVLQTITAAQVQQKTPIPLYFPVSGGGTYHLNAAGSTVSSIYRTSSGAVYPYVVPGIVSIKQAINGADGYYYFFYDWKIQSGCLSDRYPVSVHIDSPVVFAAASSDTICFGDQVTLSASGALSYIWQPGNLSGSTINEIPLVNTIYTVVGTDGYGCSNTATTGVAVITCAVGVANATVSFPTVRVFPNPSGGIFNLQFTGLSGGTYTVTFLNTLGQSVLRMKKNILSGESVIAIDATALASDTYFVRIEGGNKQWMERIIKQ